MRAIQTNRWPKGRGGARHLRGQSQIPESDLTVEIIGGYLDWIAGAEEEGIEEVVGYGAREIYSGGWRSSAAPWVCSVALAAPGAGYAALVDALAVRLPWTLTTMDASIPLARSAASTRSVPDGSALSVITAWAPASRAAAAIPSWSVATRTAEMLGARRAARTTCATIGRPASCSSGLPGSRVEPKRAGMTATVAMDNGG